MFENEETVTITILKSTDELIRSRGGFGDDHDSVIVREFRVASGSPVPAIIPPKALVARADSPNVNDGKRAKKGTVTPSEKYSPFIMHVLYSAKDHQLPSSNAQRMVEELMRARNLLKDVDYLKTTTGAVRWKNKCQWSREILRTLGFIASTEEAGHGIWKLTSKGVQAAKRVADLAVLDANYESLVVFYHR